jgi:hypothetical protein
MDKTCGRVLMFHGDSAEPVMCGPAASIFLEDGWAFDPARGTWQQIEVAAGSPLPLRRARGHAVWDEMRNRMILFGGRYRQGTTGNYTYLNDVWAFDPSTKTWEELSPVGAANGPTGRMNSSMVADPANDRILIHGGGQVAADFMSFIVDNQTWAFELGTRTWSRLGQNNAPRPRLFHVSAYDRNRARLYVFGGGGADSFTATSFYQDLWYLDIASDQWFSAPMGNFIPAGRIKAELEYDGPRDQLLLFGGHDDTRLGNDNDLWRFDLENLAWERIHEGDVYNRPAIGICDFPADFTIIDPCLPERRESHLFEIFGNLAYMHGGRTDCGLANDTWVLDLTTMTWSRVNSSFTGMTCFRSGRTDCMEANAKKCG